MTNTRSFRELVRSSYKPSANELILRDEFIELKNGLFKGVVPKLIRMSGELYNDIDVLMASTEEQTDEEHEALLQKTLRSIDNVTNPYIHDSTKKRIFYTGRRAGKHQLLLTKHVYPVPHVKGISLTLVTVELGIIGTDIYGFKSTRWGIAVDDHVTEEERNHYISDIRLSDVRNYETYIEMMKHIVFQVTPFRLK